jgi:hypothetical protein
MIVAVLVIVSLLLPTGVGAAGQTSKRASTQNELVEQHLLPHVAYLFEKLLDERRNVALDGVRAFEGGDRFLPGKIAVALSHLVVNTPRTDPKFAQYLAGFREIAELTVDDPNDTWGIYYYLSALNRLRKAGLLGQAVSPAVLAKLRIKLDWRSFIKVPGFTLIDHPTNYYGVAFSIARLRLLLGWEGPEPSRQFLSKMVSHYQRYSGEYGFSDETDGEGRFDRYSVLLIGEICLRFIETDMRATPQLKRWLRKSVEVMLVRMNQRGDGWDYGRSIGPYGDTAPVQVLAAAAYLDVLSPQEKEMAYAFTTLATAKFVNFWYDPEMRSLNLWEKGRRTDAYRGKHRILGENMSLLDQLMSANELWNEMGFRNKPPADLSAWLLTLPTFTFTRFARGEYDRGLVTYRDRSHIFSLPIVNGGRVYHSRNAYFPIPHSTGLIEGTPDEEYPQLVPRFTLADSSVLMPIAYARQITTAGAGDRWTVTYRQDEVDRVGAPIPIKDDRMKVEVSYVFEPGSITRTERYTPSAPLAVTDISMTFASFSSSARLSDARVVFAEGNVEEFSVTGLDACSIAPANDTYRASNGPMKTVVSCATRATTLTKPFAISWTVKYR